ncbi:hypothetical protein CS542_10440 [Pedobacter sp. IW39]|nr:hypothetical protein CS542_10440 [Pedobacter sp. IW39]
MSDELYMKRCLSRMGTVRPKSISRLRRQRRKDYRRRLSSEYGQAHAEGMLSVLLQTGMVNRRQNY